MPFVWRAAPRFKGFRLLEYRPLPGGALPGRLTFV